MFLNKNKGPGLCVQQYLPVAHGAELGQAEGVAVLAATVRLPADVYPVITIN